MDSIEVCLTTAGAPLPFIRDSRVWRVAIEPLRWYERVAWWETTQRMPRSQMTRLDIEVWQVQARIGHNHRSPLVTFELVHGQDRQIWSIRSMDTIAT